MNRYWKIILIFLMITRNLKTILNYRKIIIKEMTFNLMKIPVFIVVIIKIYLLCNIRFKLKEIINFINFIKCYLIIKTS